MTNKEHLMLSIFEKCEAGKITESTRDYLLESIDTDLAGEEFTERSMDKNTKKVNKMLKMSDILMKDYNDLVGDVATLVCQKKYLQAKLKLKRCEIHLSKIENEVNKIKSPSEEANSENLGDDIKDTIITTGLTRAGQIFDNLVDKLTNSGSNDKSSNVSSTSDKMSKLRYERDIKGGRTVIKILIQTNRKVISNLNRAIDKAIAEDKKNR